MPKIIKVKKKDLKQVGQFEKAEWHKLDREHYGKPIVSYMDKKFHYAAREDGEVIGTIKGTYELGVVYISSLIVVEKRRGQGVGKALLAKVARRGKNLGCHKIFLFTGSDWRANKFYKSLGFRKTGQMRNFYHRRDFNIYEKDL